jgi:hypothetical protein
MRNQTLSFSRDSQKSQMPLKKSMMNRAKHHTPLACVEKCPLWEESRIDAEDCRSISRSFHEDVSLMRMDDRGYR